MTDYQKKFSLKGKTAFVSGGAGLIGQEITTALATAGARVIILDIDEKKSSILVKKLKTKGFKISFDYFNMSDLNNLETSFQKLIKKYKTVDIFVNSSYPRSKDWGSSNVETLPLTSFRENVDIHLNSYVWSSRIVASLMKKNKIAGSIINISSIYGLVGNDPTLYEGTKINPPFAYSAIKAGIINATRYLAAYFGANNIRINAICPGGIFDQQDPKFVKRYEHRVPLKRMGRSDEIASVVLFLASEASSYITGSAVVVDGGWTTI